MLFLIAEHVYADFLLIGTSPQGDIFIDESSLKKMKSEVTFKSVLNLKEKTNRGTSSLKIESTINCQKMEIVDLNMLSYDETYGNGKLIDNWKPELKWRAIEANNHLYKFLCNR